MKIVCQPEAAYAVFEKNGKTLTCWPVDPGEGCWFIPHHAEFPDNISYKAYGQYIFAFLQPIEDFYGHEQDKEAPETD